MKQYIILLILFFIIQVFDVVSTDIILRSGGSEINLVPKMLLDKFGFISLIFLKFVVFTIILALSASWFFIYDMRTLAVRLLVVLVIISMYPVVQNLTQLIIKLTI